MKEYRPLPDYLTIEPSDIEGLGLFATEDLEYPLHIGLSHFQYKDELKREPYIAFCNHSTNPNVEIIWDEDLQEAICRTIKNIKAGEELVAHYGNTVCGSYYKEFTNGE